MGKISHRLVMFSVAGLCSVMLLSPDRVYSGSYKALEGVTSFKAVFDIRVATPAKLAVHLDMINDIFEDQSVTAVQGKPDFVIIFMGPAVKFISNEHDGYSPEESAHLDAIAAMVPVLADNGITLQVCMFAAASRGVAPDSILEGIEPVKNGWISSIGYQNQGYAVVSDF